MVEVFTIGGGEYIVNTFNAVAAWTGGGGYKSLLKVVMVLGLIYALLTVAFSLNVRAWLNWFLGSSLIYLCLMVPTIDVKVTDRINPDLAPATVANVPLGLAVMASFTSQVGDYLTRTAETVFVMPAQLNYSTNGMIYGSRLFEATRNFQIRDVEYATNLQEHFKRCVFGDIMLHQKSLTDLARSTDLWTDLGPGSAARSQAWLDRSGGVVTSSIITCRQAHQNLSVGWEALMEAHAGIWGKEAYPGLSTELAAAKLRQDVPIANTAFTNAASDFNGTMRQMTAINAFMQARDGMAGGTGSATIDTFATTRADIQARNTYASIAQQAMSWVPILNVVLTVVFYAMFPVIFPLLLMPQTGVGALKGYVTGFFYLASWGPLYVILHMICTTRSESAAQGVAEGGVALNTFAGIGAVNAETATIAGFMLMSVPFIAGGLARGALGVASQATSILAPAQNAAEAAALEQTTGNYAYGNVSYANTTASMYQSNQMTTAPSMFDGAASFTTRQSNGATLSSYGDSNTVIDTSKAISNLPFTATMSETSTNNQARQASEAHRIVDSTSQNLRREISHLQGLENSHTTTASNVHGFDASSGTRDGDSLDVRSTTTVGSRTGADERVSGSEATRRQTSVGDSTNRSDQLVGGVRGSLTGSYSLLGGGGGKGNGKGSRGDLSLGATADVGKNWSSTNTASTNNERSVTGSKEQQRSMTVGSSVDDTVSASENVNSGNFRQVGEFARSELATADTEAKRETLQRIISLSDQAQHAQEIARTLDESVSHSRSHGFSLNENMNNDLAHFYMEKESQMRGMIPSLHQVNLDASERSARNAVIAEWADQYSRKIENELSSQLNPEGLSNLAIRPIDQSEASISARYKGSGKHAAPGPVQTLGGDTRNSSERIKERGADLIRENRSMTEKSRRFIENSDLDN